MYIFFLFTVLGSESHPPVKVPAKEQTNYPIVKIVVNMNKPILIPILSMKNPPNKLNIK